jgi:peptidoglycan hydrolase-like protein with peptidoglycan-binding domain
MIRNLAGAAFATIQDYPSIAAGACAFAVAFGLIAGNAVYGQSGGHPGPIWATRDPVTTQSVGQQARLPVRKVRTETIAALRIPVPDERPQTLEPPAADPVRAAQEALLALGLYDGEVDGKLGPKTREAVKRFQRKHGVEADGEVSQRLAAAMAREAEAASERAGVQRERERQVDTMARVEQAVLTEPVRVDNQSVEEVAHAAAVARVQIGLMNFGEPGISVDGVLGPQTVSAIRAFQKRYGLAVTGEPDDAVIRKLEQIGALRAAEG